MLKVKSFAELLTFAAATYPSTDAFRIRSGKGYKSISYAEFRQQAFSIAAYLTKNNFSAENNKIALLGENSYHWVLSYLSTVISGAVIVPIDKELNAIEIANILEQSGASAIFCSEDYFDVLAETGTNITAFAINTTENTDFHTIETLVEQGGVLLNEDDKYGQNETSVETLSTIVFTSGTTGFSKGVMLSRRNLLSNISNTDDFIKLKGSNLSLLPMNHTYEFTLDILLSFLQGVTVSINNGIKNFQQNLQIFAPENLIIVPLVAESLLKSIWMKIEDQGKLSKVRTAIKVSNFLLKLGIDVRRKLFAPIHQGLGGNVKQLFIGGALLSPDVAQDLHNFGFRVNIGYGITECAPFVSGNIIDNPRFFTSCGVTIPNTHVKIDNPNELAEGEILVSGPSVMMGYYKNQVATDDVMTDNWFRTGDIGRLGRRNMLYITGRVKNLIVLNNGKNIYPEELEALIAKSSDLVKEVVVKGAKAGDNQELNIVAEVFADPDAGVIGVDVENEIRLSIEKLNDSLPYFKRIVEVKFRENEFPKTTTKKIKRY